VNRYVCIHGHFYQPPRENAWLEEIETQPSAYPYHDWNELINAQCYMPNSIARIMDDKSRVIEITSNYSRMSFDFGPTLLSWLEEHQPDVYAAILEADKESQRNYSGHGSALAQAYNHIIMPLANTQDKYTQVYWGIRDFEHRFKRQPEGMWLPEAAVDMETLDIMSSQGIKFVILAPRQALRVRKIREREWHEVNENTIDTTLPYKIKLGARRDINIFFYNSAIAVDVAFHGLLSSGEELANRLVNSLKPDNGKPQLAHIATDGESYGHHHLFGEMALAYAFYHINKNNLARITNYGEFLELHPPVNEVQIRENSSWSCVHGVERWRSDCGCTNHYHPGWNQKWRTPLRKALDWLRDTANNECEKRAKSLFKDLWGARNGYIEVILDRSSKNIKQFMDKYATHKLNREETVTALKIMEIQRHSLLMYTSCGWFFDDLARIETVQVIQYASRVAELAHEICGSPFETEFLKKLSLAQSNITDYGNGRQIYMRFVKPTSVDFKRVAAHFAISSFFERYPETSKHYSYEVSMVDFNNQTCGKNKINFGRLTITSSITREAVNITLFALLQNDRTAMVGVSTSGTFDAYDKLKGEVSSACSMDDTNWIELALKTNFPGSIYTISSLFRDAQHIILENVMNTSLLEMKELFYPALESFALVTPLADEATYPLPEMFYELIQLILNLELRREFRKKEGPEVDIVKKRVDDAKLWGVSLDSSRLSVVFSNAIEKVAKSFVANSENVAVMEKLITMVGMANSLPFHPDLQSIQAIYYKLSKTSFPDFKARKDRGDAIAAEWIQRFTVLGELLHVRIF
jgi:alpha-amylase/alpha-mannosidase (GH57 family)